MEVNSFKIQFISVYMLRFCCQVLAYFFPECCQAEQLVLIHNIHPPYDITDSFITSDAIFFFPPNVVTLNVIKYTLYFQAIYLEGTVIGLSSHQGYLT